MAFDCVGGVGNIVFVGVVVAAGASLSLLFLYFFRPWSTYVDILLCSVDGVVRGQGR